MLVMFLLFLGFFISKEAETQQHIYIKAPPQTVFRLVNDLKQWVSWSPFLSGEDDLSSTFSGPGRGVGSKLLWQGKDGRRGSQEIVASNPYQNLTIALEMANGAQAFDEWTFGDTTGGVLVQWKLRMTGLSYPFQRYFGYFIGGLMKPLQEKGLQNLKALAEAAPLPTPIELVETETIHALAILDSAMMPQLEQRMAEDYAALRKTMSAGRLAASGPAFAVYYNWAEDVPVKFRVAYPVAEEVREHGEVHHYAWEGGKAAKAVWTGDPAGMAKVHQDMDEYLADFGYALRGAGVYEVYRGGGLNEGDTTGHITEVYYPVK